MIQKVISHLFVFFPTMARRILCHRTATASPWNIKHNIHNKDVKENN